MADEPAFDVLGEASKSLEQASASLAALAPPLMAAAQAQQAAAAAQQATSSTPAAPASGYVYQPSPTPTQLAQRAAAAQQYPSGGAPAWQQPAPAPLVAAQQQQAAPPVAPSPGDTALAAARATPLGGAPQGAVTDSFGAALRSAAGGLLVLKFAAQQVEGTFLALAAKASPTAVATYQGSQDLLAARLGSHVLPALEEASRLIQAIARSVPDPEKKYLDRTPFELAFPGFKLLKQIQDLLGVDKPLASFKGLPQPQISTAEQYYDRLTTQALGQGPLEAELLREQLRNLEKILGVLERGVGLEGREVGSFR